MEKKGTVLRHYKGGIYEVIGVATHSETTEEMLVYQNIKEKKIWVRPINMCYENVDFEGATVPRFSVINE